MSGELYSSSYEFGYFEAKDIYFRLFCTPAGIITDHIVNSAARFWNAVCGGMIRNVHFFNSNKYIFYFSFEVLKIKCKKFKKKLTI